MTRCCADTLKHYGPRDPRPRQELNCRWCECFLRYDEIRPGFYGWTVQDRVSDFIRREGSPEATEARELAYQRILGRERQR